MGFGLPKTTCTHTLTHFSPTSGQLPFFNFSLWSLRRAYKRCSAIIRHILPFASWEQYWEENNTQWWRWEWSGESLYTSNSACIQWWHFKERKIEQSSHKSLSKPNSHSPDNWLGYRALSKTVFHPFTCVWACLCVCGRMHKGTSTETNEEKEQTKKRENKVWKVKETRGRTIYFFFRLWWNTEVTLQTHLDWTKISQTVSHGL